MTESTARRNAVDIRPQARMYGQRVTRDFIFTKSSHSSCVPYSGVVLVELRLIEGFP